VNNSVFKRDLKTAKLDDDVTLDRRVFHTCAAGATGNAPPPMIAQRTRRMMRSAVEVEHMYTFDCIQYVYVYYVYLIVILLWDAVV